MAWWSGAILTKFGRAPATINTSTDSGRPSEDRWLTASVSRSIVCLPLEDAEAGQEPCIRAPVGFARARPQSAQPNCLAVGARSRMQRGGHLCGLLFRIVLQADEHP